ncbi:quaternary amine ABC transporter ATP-binding protein [Elioraea sp.]|uniref:quaternary amine ABC transporter ATP-binding protein n=1 Tax=Elioraea sp. TaxID=2185103 RepID=UPI003F70BEDF
MALIELRRVTKIFGRAPQEGLARVRAGATKERLLAETGMVLGLHDVNLSIEAGEIFVVMGLSGSGKSTLIRHLNRLIDPTDGEVLVDGEDVLKLSTRALEAFRRRRMSMVFQRFGLMPHRTVLRNVAYGLEVRGEGAREREQAARAWVERVGLAGYEASYPHQLSGGMQQRVGLARALATGADILLMDEPFSALDPLIRSQMQDQLIALQAQLNRTVVFITHDLDEALRLGTRIAILKDGVVAQVGTPAEILLAPADDYVAAFVRDVNRARALTVEAVMRPPLCRLTDETLERALAEMRRQGADEAVVMAPEGYRGVVTAAKVEAALHANGARASLAELAVRTPTFTANTPIERVVPAALQAGVPLPVVDAAGNVQGLVTPEAVGKMLAERDGEPTPAGTETRPRDAA